MNKEAKELLEQIFKLANDIKMGDDLIIKYLQEKKPVPEFLEREVAFGTPRDLWRLVLELEKVWKEN